MDIESTLARVKEKVRNKERALNRPLGSVGLLAVSKNQNSQKIIQAYEAGQRDFAENYLEEALEKIQTLNQYEIVWHFIGRIQTNKTKRISENFAFVHSVTRLKEAQRLNDQRPEDLPVLNICLQVNINNDANKQGLDPKDVLSLAKAIKTLPRLHLRGLMAILKDEIDYQKQYQGFKSLHELFILLNQHGLELDTLSMGMSQDMDAAIAAGSTMLRIGRAIFGER